MIDDGQHRRCARGQHGHHEGAVVAEGSAKGWRRPHAEGVERRRTDCAEGVARGESRRRLGCRGVLRKLKLGWDEGV